MAAGDALGSGYEFGPPPVADPEMIGGGLGAWDPGEWTDDTQMAICIAQVAAAGGLDPTAVGEEFLEWYRSDPADIGIQTRAVLSQAVTGEDLPVLSMAYHLDHPASSAGNGSLMRTAGVALAHLGDDDAIAASARSISTLTHADALAGDACVLWCIAIDRAVREDRLDGIVDGLELLGAPRREFWAIKIAEAENHGPETFTPNGFVVTALQAAYAAIRHNLIPDGDPGLHLRFALRTAVKVGDDTDTVAAIAGALLGGRWGVASIPEEWRGILHGWPGYTARDLEELATRILEHRA